MESRPTGEKREGERGAALLSSLLVMLLMAGVTAGFTALVITDTRVRALDSTRTQSFYAVHAGLEKLTADLGDLFAANPAPTGAQINALMTTPPAIGVTWQQPDGTNGYRITYPVNGAGNPDAKVMTVQNGPFQGLVGLATKYDMVVTGRLSDGSESSLTRSLQTVAIPVFQFGIFSENNLSFFPGPDFNFGGRVHSNQSIFLATEATTPGLTLQDRVTAVGEIIRQRLSNGASSTGNGYNGNVRVAKATNSFRNLAPTEGSVTDGLGSSNNEPTWSNLSEGTYNHNIMNGRTGARRLDLPITQFGATPIDLIKRPAVNEDVDRPNVLAERFYTLASLRILLSDTAAEITDLPGVTATAPVELGQNVPAGYTVSSVAAQPRPRFGRSPAPGSGVIIPQDTPLMGGFLKIEKQTSAGNWVDVTLEILSLGINSPQLHSAAQGAMTYNNGAAGAIACRDWTPNAILRLQRLWDTGGADPNGCWTLAEATVNSNTGARRYSPLALYDPREGIMRDTAPATMQLGGIMYFVELDARNLARWFRGQIPAANCPIACSGANAWNVNGYTVYFSDRRGNKNVALVETGEYGFEDVVNPTAAGGAPNGVLNTGEDFNEDGVQQLYGGTARLPYGVPNWGVMAAPLLAASTPVTQVGAANTIAIARRNTPIFFRRALKLTRGADLNAAAPGLQGLTIASENPVYIQGNWNANGTFAGAHVATAVLADAVTLLSNEWNDRNSFANPHVPGNRDANTAWYRVAIIAGKGLSFPQPAGTEKDFGTDGGAHNFLRYIESWAGTLNYRGSIASLYTSRQAVGTYKCCDTVYSPPERGYNFDTEFLTPALLPPRTPMFRDVNITGFAQIIRP